MQHGQLHAITPCGDLASPGDPLGRETREVSLVTHKSGAGQPIVAQNLIHYYKHHPNYKK